MTHTLIYRPAEHNASGHLAITAATLPSWRIVTAPLVIMKKTIRISANASGRLRHVRTTSK